MHSNQLECGINIHHLNRTWKGNNNSTKSHRLGFLIKRKKVKRNAFAKFYYALYAQLNSENMYS